MVKCRGCMLLLLGTKAEHDAVARSNAAAPVYFILLDMLIVLTMVAYDLRSTSLVIFYILTAVVFLIAVVS